MRPITPEKSHQLAKLRKKKLRHRKVPRPRHLLKHRQARTAKKIKENIGWNKKAAPADAAFFICPAINNFSGSRKIYLYIFTKLFRYHGADDFIMQFFKVIQIARSQWIDFETRNNLSLHPEVTVADHRRVKRHIEANEVISI